MYPADLKYTQEHEWLKLEGNKRARVGITEFAQHELGDVVFVELPEIDADAVAGQNFAVVESVKAVSDIFAPVSGKVVEINDALADNPELINQDPYGKGWIAVIEFNDDSELINLLDAAAYEKHVSEA